jgi:uncharacterized protein YndB with AHSA1/START domain
MKPELHYTLFIGKPAREVWNALVTKETVDRYHIAPLHTLELQEDGRISYGAEEELISGRILSLEEPTRLVHTFHFAGSKDSETQVAYEIETEGEKMCSLTISHTGFEEENQTFANISGGWPVIASSLKTLLETGKSLPWPQ